jgi:predicted transcriptional regulator
MLADRNCLKMLEMLRDRKVHRIDEVRTELRLSEQKMARVTSALLKTALIKETGDDSQHHTYQITDLGLACLPKLRAGWPQEG